MRQLHQALDNYKHLPYIRTKDVSVQIINPRGIVVADGDDDKKRHTHVAPALVSLQQVSNPQPVGTQAVQRVPCIARSLRGL